MWQALTNHACRGRENTVGVHIKCGCSRRRNCLNRLYANSAREGVGVSRVYNDRCLTTRIAPGFRLTIKHCRRAGGRTRIHASNRCFLAEQCEHDIRAASVFYPCRSRGKAHALDDRKHRELRRREWRYFGNLGHEPLLRKQRVFFQDGWVNLSLGNLLNTAKLL